MIYKVSIDRIEEDGLKNKNPVKKAVPNTM